MSIAVRLRMVAVGAGIAAAMGAVPAMAAGVAPAPAAAVKVCDATKYGAKGDGTTKDTKAIQAAIDACSGATGGGTVVLSKGIFLSGPIVLKSNVTLNIAAGSILLGSPDHDGLSGDHGVSRAGPPVAGECGPCEEHCHYRRRRD